MLVKHIKSNNVIMKVKERPYKNSFIIRSLTYAVIFIKQVNNNEYYEISPLTEMIPKGALILERLSHPLFYMANRIFISQTYPMSYW